MLAKYSQKSIVFEIPKQFSPAYNLQSSSFGAQYDQPAYYSCTNYVTMTDVVYVWSEVTGKMAVFAEIQDTGYSKMFGLWGTELASQFWFSEEFQLP